LKRYRICFCGLVFLLAFCKSTTILLQRQSLLRAVRELLWHTTRNFSTQVRQPSAYSDRARSQGATEAIMKCKLVPKRL